MPTLLFLHSSRDLRRAVACKLQKNAHLVLVNCLWGESRGSAEKHCLNMSSAVYHGRKQQQKKRNLKCVNYTHKIEVQGHLFLATLTIHVTQISIYV